ncbi:putative alternative oxidase protein [Botrytis fragariae]|uniref:Putative alternative oxidase protein n=1 Tax=Botrytis fragariae TaxID=1964551 RepID=A0A8H6AZM1_9HELO|nr:putative alternative oxidase protein [Botrytis fragariae]KAF5876561.1 putative alternative oxidase protein [Botrytis fragariae]
MSVRRTRSVSKWKEVLGFDEGFYPTSETPPPYHRYESPESIYESVGSISPTVSYYHETLEELTPKFHYHDAPEVVNHSYNDAPEVIDTPLDYTYSDAPEAVIEPSDALKAVIKSSDAPEAVIRSPTSSNFSQTPISAITSRFNTTTHSTHAPSNTASHTPINPSSSGIRFPRDLTFTRNSIYDILLSPSSAQPVSNGHKPASSPPPLFYITIHQSTPQSRSIPPPHPIHPSSLLQALTPYNHPPTAHAPALPLTPPSSSSHPSKSIVPPPTTYNLPTSPNDSLTFGVRSQGYKTEKLVPTGGIFTAERYAFYHTLPRTFVKEKFEWRQVSSSSSAPHVGLASVPEEMTSKKGGVKMKLMRCSTGETIAVYVGVGNEDWADKERKRRPRKERGKVLGMMRWLELESGSAGLGDEFELMGVMSVLGVMERWRRVMNVQKQLGMFTS